MIIIIIIIIMLIMGNNGTCTIYCYHTIAANF
jgi:hypothetical protein